MSIFGGLLKKQKGAARPFITAIIAAGGSGKRMGDKYPSGKLLIPLRGQPVIAYTLAAFEKAKSIDEIIVVCREEDILSIGDIVKGLELKKVSKIIRGGDERQRSVENGIAAADPKSSFVAIHDGARPLITPEIIDEAAASAIKFGAAAVGVPETDTLKKIYDTGFIASTVDRQRVYRIQTPQIFELVPYVAALSLANQQSATYTDDCQLYEALGKSIKLVEGSTENIKITSEEDVAIAEAILERRRAL